LEKYCFRTIERGGDRFTNSKGAQSIYLIRVAKGATISNDGAELRGRPNYAAVIDEPNELIIAGYFVGRPNTEELFAHLTMRRRINKADGKTTLSVDK